MTVTRARGCNLSATKLQPNRNLGEGARQRRDVRAYTRVTRESSVARATIASGRNRC